jgi:predicted metalloprotease
MRIDVAESGDPHGVAIDDPDSHGTDQERLDAFNVGHAGGPTACVDELVAVLPG